MRVEDGLDLFRGEGLLLTKWEPRMTRLSCLPPVPVTISLSTLSGALTRSRMVFGSIGNGDVPGES